MSEIVEVLAPRNEEGTRATVLKWGKQVGERIAKDEPLVELETDKVTVEVAAPASGILTEILKQADAEVQPDEVLARIRVTTKESEAVVPPAPAAAPAQSVSAAAPAQGLLSPAVRLALKERGLRAEDIRGSGLDGRITVDDVERRAAATHTSERLPHSAVRRRIAEHMSRSLSIAPHVTTVFETDLSRVLAHRAQHAAAYAQRAARLTLTAYFLYACARALQQHRQVNATFHPDALELHADVNIGIGTSLGEKGLIVPVLHRAQSLDLFDTALRLGELTEAARAGTLAPEAVRGGTFTISNHGIGGSLLAAPIVINQPQVAILGIGKVQRRVCAVEVDGAEAIAVRPMCYLTLSLDHRVLDAFHANAFLSAVVAQLEQWPLQP